MIESLHSYLMSREELSDFFQPLIHDKNTNEIQTNHTDQTSTNTTSFSHTCFHGLNALSGAGILSIPYALQSGGWLSLILLFAIAATTYYTSLLIQKCMDLEPNIKTYPEIGFRAFGNKGKIVISLFMHLELYLVATGFLILEGDNLHKIFPDFEFDLLGIKLGGQQGFVIIVALIVLPTVWLDNLTVLSYVSASGVLASFVIVGSVFWVGAFDGVGFKQTGIWLNWKGLPTSVSLYAFCYCAHPVFPTLYTSMKNKRQFSYVMVICFVLCTMIYASMAVLGYLMFGQDIESQITLNLPTRKLSSKIAICTTLVNPIAKYALMVTPIIDAIKTRFSVFGTKRSIGLLIGTGLVISTVIVALLFPFFGSLMSLVGAFLSITASVILPCLCYLKISGSYRRLGFETSVLGCVLVMGVVVALTGTYAAVKELVGNM